MVISSSYKESSSPKDLPGSATAWFGRAYGRNFALDQRELALMRQHVPRQLGESACADKLGLWADPYYEVLNGKAGLESLSISGGGGRVILRLRS
jgi:hypothetical protein